MSAKTTDSDSCGSTLRDCSSKGGRVALCRKEMRRIARNAFCFNARTPAFKRRRLKNKMPNKRKWMPVSTWMMYLTDAYKDLALSPSPLIRRLRNSDWELKSQIFGRTGRSIFESCLSRWDLRESPSVSSPYFQPFRRKSSITSRIGLYLRIQVSRFSDSSR